LWRNLCAATKVGSEIKAHHLLDTQLNRHADLTGTLKRISKVRSCGNIAMVVVVASVGASAQPVAAA
jgi:hypothetical protein